MTAAPATGNVACFCFVFSQVTPEIKATNFPVVPDRGSDSAGCILSTDSKNIAVHLAFAASCVDEAISRAEPLVVDSVYVSGRVALGQEPEMAMTLRNRQV